MPQDGRSFVPESGACVVAPMHSPSAAVPIGTRPHETSAVGSRTTTYAERGVRVPGVTGRAHALGPARTLPVMSKYVLTA